MNLLDKADDIIIGSAMAFPFLKVMHGMSYGNSLYDASSEKFAKEILETAKAKGINLHFPSDFVCGDAFSNDANVGLFELDTGIPDGWIGMDQGPKTCKSFEEVINKAETIVWNGPQGVFEMDNFKSGSLAVVKALEKRTQEGATTIVGGGDSVTLVMGVEVSLSVKLRLAPLY